MMKSFEISDPASCLNKARPDELIFVLLGRDVAAPAAIRAWAKMRVVLGRNVDGDQQIQEALECAELMEQEQEQGT